MTPQYVILEPINKVENDDNYVLTLNHGLQADSSTESQTFLGCTFPTTIPSGHFKYKISKVIFTTHVSSTFFPFFSLSLKLIQISEWSDQFYQKLLRVFHKGSVSHEGKQLQQPVRINTTTLKNVQNRLNRAHKWI